MVEQVEKVEQRAGDNRQTVELSEFPDLVVIHLGDVCPRAPSAHLGMRQYWSDLDALERWTRELPHQSGGTTSGGLRRDRTRLGLGEPSMDAVIPEDALPE